MIVVDGEVFIRSFSRSWNTPHTLGPPTRPVLPSLVRRPRFDPKLLADALREVPRTAQDAKVPQPIWTVSQLAVRIEGSLRDGLPPKIRVVGEVSGPRERTHWYFDLKDAGAIISCVLFASAARRSKAQPHEGAQVVVTGHIDFYAKAGKVSLIADRIEPVGEGTLDQAFRALCDELRTLGWFDPARKRPLPVFPRRIAVVTSRSGAALHDVLDTMRRRCPAVDVALVDVRVQGDGAPAEIARAISWLSSHAATLGIDAILVTRGGGSKEDLWAFNERIVAEAIVRSSIPVVCAIGHETDTTIAELVADERAATPTQAAMRLTPDREALSRQLDAHQRRVIAAIRKYVRFERHRLDSAARHPALADGHRLLARLADRVEAIHWRLTGSMRSQLARSTEATARAARRLEPHRPVAVLARRAAIMHQMTIRLHRAANVTLHAVDLDSLGDALTRSATRRVRTAAFRLHSAQRQLEAVSPLAVLTRGYSVTLDQTGRALTSAGDVSAGDRLITRLAEGTLQSIVTTEDQATRHTQPKSPHRPKPSSPGTGEGGRPQMDLFTPER